MNDKTTDEARIPELEIHGIHVTPIKENIPDWYSQSTLRRKKELAAMDLHVPDFYRDAAVASKDKLHAAHAQGWAALNDIDRVFDGLKDCAEFTEPLLVAAIQKQFSVDLDVKKIFFATKVYDVNRRNERTDFGGALNFSTGVGGERDFYYQGITLLEAAMGNFEVHEAEPDSCENCRLLTRFDFHNYISEILPTVFAVEEQALSIPAHQFAQLCRTLDLGAQYQAHIDSILPAQDSTGAKPFLDALVTFQTTQLQASALIALERNHIKHSTYQMLTRFIAGQAHIVWKGGAVRCVHPLIEAFETRQVMLFYVTRSTRDCVLYVPGDPDKPLMEYASFDGVAQDLTQRFRAYDYRVFFSQFIPVETHVGFFATLKRYLDPDNLCSPDQDFIHEPSATLNRPQASRNRFEASWPTVAQQKLNLIRSNGKVLVVSTADKDKQASQARLWAVGSALLDVLNLVSFVVPGLGPLMMGIGAIQMLHELDESARSAARGDIREAWAHVSGVVLNLAFAAAGHQVIPAVSQSDYVREWAQIVSRKGATRLIQPDWRQYEQTIDLPHWVRADTRGLYTHDGKVYLKVQDGKYYEMKAEGEDFFILHPDDAQRYSPRSRHNAVGGWVHEFEQPLSWDRPTLMRRIGHSVDGLSDERLEQVRKVSGISDDQLRKMHIDLTPPAPLLAETIRRFQIDHRYCEFIEQMRSNDPLVHGQANIDLQLELLTHEKIWPSSRGLSVIRTKDGTTFFQAPPGSEVLPQVAVSEYSLNSGKLLDTLVSELNDDELKVLLGEDVQEARLREALNWVINRRSENPTGLYNHADSLSDEFFYQSSLDALASRPRDLNVTLKGLRQRLQLAASIKREELLNAPPRRLEESPEKWLQEAFPDLPEVAVKQLLAQADDTRLGQLNSARRPPLQLSQEARDYLDVFRLRQAYEGLYLNQVLTQDTARLLLHTLKKMPGWSGTPGLQLHDGSTSGPLLDGIGVTPELTPETLRRTISPVRRWVKHDNGGIGEVWRPHHGDSVYRSLFEMVPPSDLDVMVFPLETRWTNFRQALRRRALPPEELREVLNMPGGGDEYQSPMALAVGAPGHAAQPDSTRAFQCRHEAHTLYPGSTLEQIEGYLNVRGQTDSVMLKEVRLRQAQYDQLDDFLKNWEGSINNKQRIAKRIRACWQRRSGTVLNNAGDFVGYTLNLSDLHINDLPSLPIGMPHVSSLSLGNMRLSDNIGDFLSSFPGLRHLILSGNRLTRIPSIVGTMVGLTQLALDHNQIQLTTQSVTILAGLTQLRVLSLARNRLGMVPNVSAMTRLNQLYLTDCGLTEIPYGAMALRHLTQLDLHSNQLVDIPDALFERRQAQNEGTTLHHNPWSEEARNAVEAYRLRTGVALLDRAAPIHVSEEVARLAWLGELPASERVQRAQVWQDLRSEPGSEAFFRVLADMTRSATFKLVAARPGLVQKVWELLDDAAGDQELREQLFIDADAPGTCVDQRTDVLFKLGLRSLVHKAQRQAGTRRVEASLIELARGRFRLTALDRLIKADIQAREREDGAPFDEEVEVDLVYRISLADRLKLPFQPRIIAFGQLYEVTQADIRKAGDTVLQEEAVPGALATFMVGEPYWETQLRNVYREQFDQKFGEHSRRFAEKSDALEDLDSSLEADSDTLDAQVLHSHQQAVDKSVAAVMRLFDLRKDQVMGADGRLLDNFLSTQRELLGAAWKAEEQRALVDVTEDVLRGYSSMQA
ncbi:hypothetical protein GNF76_24325 [Pseudomonas sp. CCM 7893]|uniref:RING-type E3 ubiquitin transferase n=1 Tax=Pseudomonas spelaei TaxID=1055469 RepID=A0A6I3WB68_9PSED|nr:NEL-type E3 ubiquitin ligase domain-containing protein [Pseudomonas spelaei]MUF07485.1 hypothetical protein [Pseudomonas spelaei]